MKIDTAKARLVCKSHTAYGWAEGTGMYALAAVYNEFAAADVRCLGVEADIGIPVDISGMEKAVGVSCGSKGEAFKERVEFRQEKKTAGSIAHGIEKALRSICIKQGIELLGLHITRKPILSVPSITITGMGWRAAEDGGSQKIGQSGEETYLQRLESGRRDCEIVLTKWVGMEGMLRISGEEEDELRKRFAPVFMRQIHSYEKELFAGKEMEIARAAGVTVIRQIAEGGILAGLWELAKETGMGLDMDMKRMPVLQETIEVCEHFRMNPYQLTSAGSFLMLTEDGGRLTEAMQENQIQASIIGKLIPGKNKLIRNGGDVRYLDRPASDEIYKLFI